MKNIFKSTLLILTIGLIQTNVKAQGFTPNQAVTAAFATDGSSLYKDKVLWLTWGTPDLASGQTLTLDNSNRYGKHGTKLAVGSKSRAKIPLGSNKFYYVEAEITAIKITSVNDEAKSAGIVSYASGNWKGDYLDDFYNIGGIGKTETNSTNNNKLISGIANGTGHATTALFTIKCRAFIGNDPVRLEGMVVGDAESMDGGEYLEVIADGDWNIVEANQTNSGNYYVSKYDVTSSTKKKIRLGIGNNAGAMAVTFLKFNETAYALPDYSVTFDVTMRGGGTTAVAFGLLAPNADLGDAPESYGSPLHTLQNISFKSDKIPYLAAGSTNITQSNINSTTYTVGELLEDNKMYLGTAPGKLNNSPIHSKGADLDGFGTSEEDAWPEEYKRFSYKVVYKPGNKITAVIPYKSDVNGFITGWIDFNRNGTFEDDAKERRTVAVTANPNGTATLEWTIPTTRSPYSTYVRLRLHQEPENEVTPYSNSVRGEVEDHHIQILGPAITNPMLPNKGK
ncbi:CshA/CshB family fibrillar adhesin-related protein [Flavobacterium branchiarum]|uniref:CshA/CshB family fibrillar adhesin-related protein n=1 Tax=Flavobacterium branchiarum TaxID=1114870 RepID=A0ABV5FRC4_9FLAO|nr:CshA/CshB family fibrillar adhesin-related protein [Flavobacterium branchiarum]MDN3672808.1 CshA/CshB family fibrillar adhesin-related protein [Flavobacterium branchiarum]